MNLRRLVYAREDLDACVELLHVMDEHRAAAKLSLHRAEDIARSRASERRQKSPLLQPAFERGAARQAKTWRAQKVRELEAFARTPAARRIDERVAKERAAR